MEALTDMLAASGNEGKILLIAPAMPGVVTGLVW
jgi:hypothetical protein